MSAGPAATGGIFVTGTDTGVGKTRVAAALLRALGALGLRTVGMKPVAAGVALGEDCNADVAALRAAGNVAAPLADVNPYSFEPAIAPHLAAREAGVAIELEAIAAAYARLAATADAVVVEGAGGVLVPLGATSDMLDVPARLGLPVLLVVGIRLGCLNHTLLSTLAISARGLVLAGWVANRIDSRMEAAGDNVAALSARIAAPLLAELPWQPDSAEAKLPREALAALALVDDALRRQHDRSIPPPPRSC
jgi:dethiobiotin synthetase